MKRRLKLTPFAKIFIVVLIILGARYVYLNQKKIKFVELNSFEEIKEKASELFKQKVEKENISKKDIIVNKADTIHINITDSDDYIKISASGKTVKKLKTNNTTDTLLFNISKEKALVGKIIYNRK